jgi:excisionase family DNA binding protein
MNTIAMNTAIKKDRIKQTNSLSETLPSIRDIEKFPIYNGGLLTGPARGYGDSSKGEHLFIPKEMASKHVKLRPDRAEEWLERCAIEELEGGEERNAVAIDCFDDINNEDYAALRDAINLCFLPLADDFYYNVDYLVANNKPFSIPTEQLEILQNLKLVISLFPELASKLGMAPKPDSLMKLSEVARILEIPEAAVRKMAIDGILEFTRSQGETGHYRFSRSAILEYVESQNVK